MIDLAKNIQNSVEAFLQHNLLWSTTYHESMSCLSPIFKVLYIEGVKR